MKKNLSVKMTSGVARTVLAAMAAFTVMCGAIAIPSAALPALAAEEDTGSGETMWSEGYYRVSDNTGELSDAERDELDSLCIEFMKNYHADLALLSVTDELLDGQTLGEVAGYYFEDCDFGYGENRDGFLMIYNGDTDESLITAYGAAVDMIPADYLHYIEGSIPSFREQYGIFGPFYTTVRHFNNYMEQNHAAKGDQTGAATEGQADNASEGQTAAVSSETETVTDPSARVGESSDKPAWYPVDPQAFPKYHDETAPRVVDVADLFTDEEEALMETRLAEIRAELEKDVVIFTDVSAYGLGHDIYSADFYDFNGYGIGDEYEGAVLFICMDPSDRGWWTCCTGPETRGLYTEEVANQIDDMLYDHMVNGDYYRGVAEWIENFRRLLKNGSPYMDDWTATDLSTFERFHNEDGARIVDELGLLSESEIASLTETARELSSKYDIDVVVHTAVSPGTLSGDDYSEIYYYVNGYGLGEDYDGILLSVFKRPGYMAYSDVIGFGKCAQKLTEVNSDRLEGRCEVLLEGKEYYEGIRQWMEQTDHMMRTGRAPQSNGHWTFVGVLSLIAGSIYGGISLIRAQSKMDTPAIAENANAYYVDGSLRMKKVSDTFVDMRTSKSYSPVEKRSSGGGSSGGGRSSYSSSYRGSSGTSHSGSGRRF